MTEGPYLREIPEAAATGSVAEVYEGLRRVLGVPFVAFVYRALRSLSREFQPPEVPGLPRDA